MSDQFYREKGLPSLEKLRVLAHLYIPAGASKTEASSWLRSQKPGLPSEVVSAVVQLHLEDSVLEGWRNDRYHLTRVVL